MAIEESILDTREYRLVFVQRESSNVLALSGTGSRHLPRIRILHRARPAEQLRKICKTTWALETFILDFMPSQDSRPTVAIAEVVEPRRSNDLSWVRPESIATDDLPGDERERLLVALSGNVMSPFSKVGWIDEAVEWVEIATQQKVLSKTSIDQLNAGGAFSLIRFRTENGGHYWLKATGEPNAHELAVTSLLSGLCADCLPQLISSRPSWNAWLTSEESTSVLIPPTAPRKLFQMLRDAAHAMANLQIRTLGSRSKLLDAGAFDQGIAAIRNQSETLFEYLEEAMSVQVSNKVPRLERGRLREIRTMFEKVCCRMEDLRLPETIVHGDLNCGNILSGFGRCQFIDWAEAYLGNPLISLEHLLLLNRIESLELRTFVNRAIQQRYRDAWSKIVDPAAFEAAFVYVPLLAIVCSLLGRGNWLAEAGRDNPRRQARARCLARYMDRAARAPELLEALCR